MFWNSAAATVIGIQSGTSPPNPSLWPRRVCVCHLDFHDATAVDTCDRARGSPPRQAPAAVAGAPTRRRPAGARPGLGWMPMLAPEDVTPDDPPLYSSAGRIGGNVHRALSLVPQAMMQFWDMFETMYLPQDAMRDFGREYRAITHPQIEMLAARVAVLNHCVY